MLIGLAWDRGGPIWGFFRVVVCEDAVCMYLRVFICVYVCACFVLFTYRVDQYSPG